jgi:hypothetical protein
MFKIEILFLLEKSKNKTSVLNRTEDVYAKKGLKN